MALLQLHILILKFFLVLQFAFGHLGRYLMQLIYVHGFHGGNFGYELGAVSAFAVDCVARRRRAVGLCIVGGFAALGAAVQPAHCVQIMIMMDELVLTM